MLLSTWESGWASFVQMFFFIGNNIAIYCRAQFHTDTLQQSFTLGENHLSDNVTLSIQKRVKKKTIVSLISQYKN